MEFLPVMQVLMLSRIRKDLLSLSLGFLSSNCCRRSSRGHDHSSTLNLDLGNQRLLNPCPVLGMFILPTIPAVGAV